MGVAVDESGLAPDGVSVSAASAILNALPSTVVRLALTLSCDPDELERVARDVRPEILHVGADLESVGADLVERLKRRHPDVAIMRAVPVTDEPAVVAAVELARVADYLLLDTKDHSTGKIGATGRSHDWSISAEIVRRVEVPVVLAGGLSADNVGAAIRLVRPWGVDSFSLTCVDGDLRRKAPDKVARFVAAVRQVDYG